MTAPVRERLLTPSKVTAWLDCPHYLALCAQVDDGTLPRPDYRFGSFAELLLNKGLAHERDCLANYRSEGKSILEVPEKGDRSFAAWTEATGNPLGDYDVVYQMPFIHNGIRGVADFVVRVADLGTGEVSYEPVDAKLTRTEAKPGHVLQLCFYADAIEALTGRRPEHMHIWLGSGGMETLRVSDFQPYWRRLQRQLAAALAGGPEDGTVPEPCAHCDFCEFQPTCEMHWRDADSLIYVANILKPDRDALVDADIVTLAALATADGPLEGVAPERLARLRAQASLQVIARHQEEARPPFELIEEGEPPWGHGFETLPKPDAGDVFLDFEGHPFWRADTGLFFLFGLVEQDSSGQWQYRCWWAHDVAQEAAAVEALVDYVARRREQFPGMHVYHYNHTERSSLQRMTETHGVAELALAELIDTGAFVDLLLVARNSIQVGTESYGLKHLERLTDYERSHEIDQGAGAVVQYEHYMAEPNQSDLDAIAAYNEDDVRATLALRDWLVGHRPPELPWRAAVIEPDPGIPELDEMVARLHGFPPGTEEHDLGDLLCYWRDEWFAYVAPKKVKLAADPLDLLDDAEAIADLSPVGLVERLGKRGTPITPAMRFTFPAQELERFPAGGGSVMIATSPDEWRSASIDRLDRAGHTLDLLWNEELQESGCCPRAAVLHDWVPTKPKPEALQTFAEGFLDGRNPNPVTLALLRRDLPRFTDRTGRVFVDDLDDMTEWVTKLDQSVVAVQGPPGTGKTYRGARLIRALVRAGKRVGITAVSHYAIANLLEGVVEAFTESGELDLLSAGCNPGSSSVRRLPDVTYGGNTKCARDEYNVVAGTTWLFSNPVMRDAPVDVLLIDEAGQLALADALAASGAAHNLVLLGDPLQLPQVAQASHPGISGRSVLDHIVGDEVLLPEDRGVFLRQTRRMHSDVCGFISRQIYDGRLHSYADCDQQSTVAGTGLRWLRVDHEGNRTWSVQEADAIASELMRLLGTPWTNHKGEAKALQPSDFMVVAPYNLQVNAIRARLEQNPALAEVPVGTVDKFQGREAAVVFFSMAASSGEDITRGVDFLFSRNRLNVAVSRARCLAYLVCTDALLDTRARTVEDMRLVSTLNAFVESAS
ncbi:ATPase [Mycolicibacterium chitae]|uniref:RecB family nuclease n=1 Tax=Mycolicibacterium chitae TaxID=1792 RepID=A0A3S4VH67_MYCCI|nr:TM0106 family RecB-like putative nuclease [Mycolicibacterium chitae]MCV7105291.1 TM0106 family RecB-like putative nuclease [Mycolicibacterium chitae]BBZ03856.1 ATPase [Mycolicibacterium chitae]VEG47507.1 RecB family nuclease [Mycolicibacterium chitae]